MAKSKMSHIMAKSKMSHFLKVKFPKEKRSGTYSVSAHSGNQFLSSRPSYKTWPWKGIWITAAAACIIFTTASK